ncbi:polysaccharide deacetylase family protein [Paenibacillus aestuarii]|uniref:Polysaccharide deacetylase family protein n=1 Tax=Paenibacillus aestuarii TaxID=516965 RepID=A0ABW0K9C5_9BACL|nr:polysaccharide deacetylase family protein [Paenibacillus aestuarii]
MISVICCTMRDEFIDNVFENYLKQRLREKELMIILNQSSMDLKKWREKAAPHPDISVYQLSENKTLGECLNFGIKLCKHDIIAKMDDDDYYGPNYLANQLRMMNKMNADVVCKRTVYMFFENKKKIGLHLANEDKNTFVKRAGGVKGSTLVIKKYAWERINFLHVNIGEDFEFIKRCIWQGYNIYVTDENDYVCLRRWRGNHTWKINNQALIQQSKILGDAKSIMEFIVNKKKEKGRVVPPIYNCSLQSRHIALTFDDGPDPVHTPIILDLLRQYDAKATFFVVGEQLERHPELARRIVDEGHEIGNHSFYHPYLTKLTSSEIYKELIDTELLIRRITGKRTRLFRLPYLEKNPKVMQIVNELGYKPIMCSIDTYDYEAVGFRDIVKSVMTSSKRGEIVLFHDSGGDQSETVKAVGLVLKKLRNQGYRCVSVSRLLDIYRKQ